MASAGMLGRRFAGAWLLLAGMGDAEEPPQPALESGLPGINQRYEAMQSARAPSAPSAIAVPIRRAIDIKSGEAETDVFPNPSRRLSPKKKGEQDPAAERERSRNWLIDGVVAQAKEDARGRNGGVWVEAAAVPEPEPVEQTLLSQPEGLATPVAGSTILSLPLRESEGGPLTGATNPLGPFMSLWMQSADFELLVATNAPLGGELATPTPAAARAGESLASIPAPVGASSLAPVSSSAGAGNPYLQAMQTGFAEVRAVSDLLPAVSPPVPAAPRESADESVASPPSPPLPRSEILRARDDTRYFKQLKRF